MDAGLYRVPKGLTHTSNPKLWSRLPILSVKQLPSIMVLSLYEMPNLHFSSATGVCSFIRAKLSKNSKLFSIFDEYLTYDETFIYFYRSSAGMLFAYVFCI